MIWRLIELPVQSHGNLLTNIWVTFGANLAYICTNL